MPDHSFVDDLPLFALGALQGDERKELEEHLAAGCERCETEVESLRSAVALLPYTVPEHQPPAELKERVLKQVATLRPSLEMGAFPPPIPRHSHGWWLALAAAAVVVIGVGVAVLTTRQHEIEILQSEKQSLASILKDQERQLEWMKDPRVQMALLKGVDGPAQARLLFHPEARQGLLYARGLAPAPEGKCYELWAFIEGEPAPAGIFDVGADGTTVVPVSRHESLGRKPDRFAVSVEPKEGMPRPTGKVVLLGGLL